MAELRMEIGKTDGFRYIGIQPPLTDEQRERLWLAEYMDIDVTSSFSVRSPEIGQPYSETGIQTERFGSPDGANEAVVRMAHKIASIISNDGDTVHVDESLKPIGFGYSLFGGRAEQLG